MIIPAIDLIDGKVVRLFQGDYSQKTDFDVEPLQQLLSYQNQGAEWLHIVDLTGAKDPDKRQLSLIKNITKNLIAKVQIGGGIRNRTQVAELLEAGVDRVVIGSLAVKNPDLVSEWILEFGPERICLALDINIDDNGNKFVAVSGWQQASRFTLEQLVYQYQIVGLKHALVTDISCDGTLSGSNVSLYKQLHQQFPDIFWQASGGIGDIHDVLKVKQSGVNSLIIGKALLINKFNVEEAISCWQNA